MSRVVRFVTYSVLLGALSAGIFLVAQQPPAKSIIILNAQIADGTGAPLRSATVRITGDHIARIGSFAPDKSDELVDAKGLVLAPGFIDIHNHSDEKLDSDPLAESQIAQGITTIILGPDGGSPWPIAPWLDAHEKNPPALNIAMMVGHAVIRQQVMGNDFQRVATAAEVEKMAQLVDKGMREGALGLSTGLEYFVASYS